jgi:hypothetical protein
MDGLSIERVVDLAVLTVVPEARTQTELVIWRDRHLAYGHMAS